MVSTQWRWTSPPRDGVRRIQWAACRSAPRQCGPWAGWRVPRSGIRRGAPRHRHQCYGNSRPHSAHRPRHACPGTRPHPDHRLHRRAYPGHVQRGLQRHQSPHRFFRLRVARGAQRFSGHRDPSHARRHRDGFLRARGDGRHPGRPGEEGRSRRGHPGRLRRDDEGRGRRGDGLEEQGADHPGQCHAEYRAGGAAPALGGAGLCRSPWCGGRHERDPVPGARARARRRNSRRSWRPLPFSGGPSGRH
jgi:hypothetical protein